MQKQTIYGRWEYNMGDSTYDELRSSDKENKVFREDGVQIGGISCSADTTRNNAILITYDAESELMLTLKFFNIPAVNHKTYAVCNYC